MSRIQTVLAKLVFAMLASGVSFAIAQPLDVGSRREMFVDDALIERTTGRAEVQLHQPAPREIALVSDQSWEGNGTNYVTVFRDGDVYRMYYRGSHFSYLGGKDRPNHRDLYCYAESRDGIHWTKPELGLFAWNGSRRTTSVGWRGSHAFVPFRDTNPHARRKRSQSPGVGGPAHGLYAFRSPTPFTGR